MDLWKPQTIEPNVLYRAQIGPLVLWLKKIGDELNIAQQTEVEAEAKTLAQPLSVCPHAPKHLDFSRWIVGTSSNCFRLLPMLPDRPVVVRMEMPVNLPPRQKATFFVSIPAWIRIVTEQKPPIELCEMPTVTRSNIWFGDTVSGQLCYSLLTHARRDITSKKTERYRLVCPVEIHNTASSMLSIDRLCVHVEHLTVYEGKPRLWTNPVRITYLGPDKDDRIEYLDQPPQHDTDLTLLNKARKPSRKTLLTQSFSNFKFIPGI